MDDLTRAPGIAAGVSTRTSSIGSSWGRLPPALSAPGSARTDLSRPYASSSVLLILAIIAMAAYGFYASRGDKPLFGRPLLD